MGRRKGFFSTASRPEDDLARERDLAALVQAQRTIVQDIGVERIQANPFQARRDFTDLEDLANAIRVQGFTSRLRVRPHPTQPNMFQLVYGERRLRAARLANLTAVPCEIADHSDDDLIEIGLAENIQRRDLDPLEEAQAFAMFIEQRGYSVRRLAERIGKDKSYVDSRLALLRMPDDVRAMVTQRPDSLRAAREIAKLAAPAARRPLIEGVVAGELSTTVIRETVRELTASSPASEAAPQAITPPPPTAQVQPELARDLAAIQAILRRWEHLLSVGTTERTAVATALDSLTGDVERLAQQLLNSAPQ